MVAQSIAKFLYTVNGVVTFLDKHMALISGNRRFHYEYAGRTGGNGA